MRETTVRKGGQIGAVTRGRAAKGKVHPAEPRPGPGKATAEGVRRGSQGALPPMPPRRPPRPGGRPRRAGGRRDGRPGGTGESGQHRAQDDGQDAEPNGDATPSGSMWSAPRSCRRSARRPLRLRGPSAASPGPVTRVAASTPPPPGRCPRVSAAGGPGRGRPSRPCGLDSVGTFQIAGTHDARGNASR